MDLPTVIAILSLLVALYPVLIGQEPVSKRLPDLAQNAAVKRAAKAVAAVGLLAAAFLFFVMPRSKVIDWVPVTAVSTRTESAGERQRLVLRWDEEQARYVPASLRSQDTFPTALTMVPTAAGIEYYVGSYGAGLFAKAGSGDWRALGLEEMVITAVAVPVPGELVAATNLGLFASRDDGLTWEERGPVRDLVTALAVDPQQPATWLAGTLSGIYRSADGGNTWIGPYVPGEVVTALAFSTADSRRVFASVLGSALLRSDDGGQQWRTVYEVDTQGSMPLALDPEAADTLYVGPGGQGLFRSTDGGGTWELLGLEGFSISAILVSHVPGALVAGTDGGEGVFVSLDGGQTWQNPGALQDPVLSIVEVPTSPDLLLASTRNHGLLRSSNLGRSWTAGGLDQLFTTSRLQVKDLAAFQDDPDHLLAITQFQKTALESRDGGRSWLQVPGLGEERVDAFELINLAFTDPREVILSANSSQLLRSGDGGESWSLISANLPREGYAPVAAAGDGTLYAGPGSQGVWVLPPREVVWQRTGLSAGSVEGLWVTTSGGDLLALDAGGRLLRSHDGGQTWAQVDYRFESLAASPHDPRVLVGVTDQFEVVRSVNGGANWTVAMTLPAETDLNGARVDASADYPARFYLTSGLDLHVSHDGGESWQAERLPGRGRLFPANQGHLYFYQEGALHASADDGRTWNEIQRATTVEDLVTTVALNEGTLLAQTPDNGILVSGDGGESWRPTSIGPGPNIFDLVLGETASRRTEVATLLEEGGRMRIMRTADGVLWTPETVPCGGALSYLGRLTEAGGAKRWQLLCSEPHSLLVIDPLSLARQTISLPPRPFTVVDARVESPERAFVSGHTGIGDQQVYVTEDGGNHWLETIPPLESASWHLNRDLRSDAVITVEQAMLPSGSFAIERVAPALAYAAWLLLTLLVLLFFFRRPLLQRLALDLQQAVIYTFAPGAAGDHSYHPAFPWLVWPVLILLALFLVQGAGPDSITAEVLEQAGQSGAVQQLAALLRGLPLRMTTAGGSRFLALLLLTLGETALIVGAIALMAVILAWRSQRAPEPALIPAMVSTGTVLLLGSVVLVTAGAVPASYPAGKGAVFGLQPLDIFRLFQLFLFFRITAVALSVVAERRRVAPLALGVAYLAVTIVALWAAQILAVRLLPRYPVTGRSLVNSFPLNTFILVNALAVALYVARSLSGGRARLQSA